MFLELPHDDLFEMEGDGNSNKQQAWVRWAKEADAEDARLSKAPKTKATAKGGFSAANSVEVAGAVDVEMADSAEVAV